MYNFTRKILNSKYQISNFKWFEDFNTLSLAEGQIFMTNTQNIGLVWIIRD